MNAVEPGDENDRQTLAASPFPVVGREHVSVEVQGVLDALHDLWEDKAVGVVYEIVQHNAKLHTPYGMHYGKDAILAAHLKFLAAFPQLLLTQLSAIAGKSRTLDLSYGATISATNEGFSQFGAPTGHSVEVRVHTDYRIHSGRIIEAWTVSDGLALSRQLGMSDDDAVARVREGSEIKAFGRALGDLQRTRGQLRPDAPPEPTRGDDVTKRTKWLWHEVWNRRRLDRMDGAYSPSYRFRGPSGRHGEGIGSVQGFVLELLAAFPDAVVLLENVSTSHVPGAQMSSVRWRLQGTHLGAGRYGPATGSAVEILGITHQRFENGVFTAEWTLFDELALLACVDPGDPEPDTAQVPDPPATHPPLEPNDL